MTKSFDLARRINTTPTADLSLSRGMIINPFLEINQRFNGTSQTYGNGVLTYPVDMFIGTGSSMTGTPYFTNTQVTDPYNISNFRGFRTSSRSVVTVATGSFSATDYRSPFISFIEGTNFKHLAWGTADAKAIDVVFVITASVAGTYSLAARNFAQNRCYVTTFTLDANVPTVITKTIPGDITGSWSTNENAGIYIIVGAVTGSTWFTPSLDSWNTGNYFSHSSVTSWTSTVGASLTLSYMNVYMNGVIPSYVFKDSTSLIDFILKSKGSWGDELTKCMRYYEKSYSYSLLAGSTTATFNGAASAATQDGLLQHCVIPITYKVQKKLSGLSLSVYNPLTGALNQMCDGAGTASAVTVTAFNSNSGYVYNSGANLSANARGYCQWVAETTL